MSESQSYPGDWYQSLFDHMAENHNLTLLQSEMDEIIRVVNSLRGSDAQLLDLLARSLRKTGSDVCFFAGDGKISIFKISDIDLTKTPPVTPLAEADNLRDAIRQFVDGSYSSPMTSPPSDTPSPQPDPSVASGERRTSGYPSTTANAPAETNPTAKTAPTESGSSSSNP